MTLSMTFSSFPGGLGIAVTYKKNFKTIPVLRYFDLTQQVTQVSDKMCAIFKKLFNYVFLSLFWSVHELI